jgi:hypothetical protein
MQEPITETLRHAPAFMKSVAALVIVTFLGLTLEPLAIAANAPIQAAPVAKPLPVASPPSNEERLGLTIETIEDRLNKLDTQLTQKKPAQQEKSELKVLRQTLDIQDTQALEDFSKIEKHLQDKNLPKVIRDRHTAMVKTYKADMATLKTNLDAMDQAKDDTERKVKAKQAKDHLKAKHAKKAHPSFDPNDLPSKSFEPDLKNKPKQKKADYHRAGLVSNPTVKLAALGDFTFDKLPGASDPAYRAETTEVTLTPFIKAKALELNYDPVKIYQWVRNNVEWLPTWGATQDADVTLGSQRGNALDIASLLIALYRASGLPARYVYGSIELPADQFNNWAGGFDNVAAAMTYASMGGVPLTSITSGGKIASVQLEHVWVEAAIDFQPSRGAVNRAADSWVQLDASFKQYQDLQGLDVAAIAGIVPTALAQSYTSSGTINEAEGWVSGLNPAVLQDAQTQAQTKLQQYITTNLPNATVGDVIGGRKIITTPSTVLPASLPYRTPVIGARYATLPSGLQHAMTFSFGTDPIGEPINPVTFPWARLNNHKVTLSFKPATPADEQALASFLPPGPITDPSQLPSSIPSYLVSVIPEIAVDGQVMGQGNAMRLGENLNFTYGIQRVNGLGNHTYTYPVVAGSYLSVAVAGGSVSPVVLQNLKTRLTQTQTSLQSRDTSLIGTLNREDILGDIFFAGTLGYFGEYLALSHVASLSKKARHNLPVAYGTLGYEPNVNTLFGLPLAIKPGGIGVNVRLTWANQSLDGSSTKWRDLNMQSGMLSSSLENGVPEQMFSTPTQPVQGVSAVKALQLASNQGQRIYRITQANQAQILPNLHLDGLAMSEISQGLAAGREVIAHTDRISIPGWSGEGYIIYDPITAAGAYKITGGSNGAFLVFVGALVLVVGLFFATNVGLLFALPVLFTGAIAALGGFIGFQQIFGWGFIFELLRNATMLRAIVAYGVLLILGTEAALSVLAISLLYLAGTLLLQALLSIFVTWKDVVRINRRLA